MMIVRTSLPLQRVWTLRRVSLKQLTDEKMFVHNRPREAVFDELTLRPRLLATHR